MSPRRWGKTSLINKVATDIASEDLLVIRMDAFSCRSEYDFYNLFTPEILKQTSSKMEEWKHLAKGFMEMSFSLGITPKTHSPEDVLNLPDKLPEGNS